MSKFILNSTQIPNAYFDEYMALLTPEEWKVLTYMARRIIGFHKNNDRISVSQLTDGITTSDGRQLDYGTGLNRGAVIKALKALRDCRMVVVADEQRGSTEAPLYALQWESDRVDSDYLIQRAQDQKERNSKRTSNASAVRRTNRSTSDEPQYVSRTTTSTSDEPQCSTSDVHTKDKGEILVENKIEERASTPAPRKRKATNNASEGEKESHKLTAAGTPSPTVAPAPPSPRKTPKLGPLASALASICQIDVSLASKGQMIALNKAAQTFHEAGRTADEIVAFGQWWNASDWRGKRGEPPRLTQVGDTWGTFAQQYQRSAAPKSRGVPANETPEQRAERIARVTAEIKSKTYTYR